MSKTRQLSRLNQIKIRKLLRKTKLYKSIIYYGPIYFSDGSYIRDDIEFIVDNYESDSITQLRPGPLKNILKEIEKILCNNKLFTGYTIRIH